MLSPRGATVAFAILPLLLSCSSKSASVAGGSGSAAYDASYAVGPFTVPAASEIVMCSYVRGQNAQDEDVQSFLVEQSAGGHHVIVYTLDHPVDLAPTPCNQGGQPGWVQVIATQDAHDEIALPAGVGFHLKAGQQFAVETHYINPTAAAEVVQSSFSLKYSPPGSVTQEAHAYFVGNQDIKLMPKSMLKKPVRARVGAT